MSQLNQKVVSKINENKITLKDLHTRKKFWWKPQDEDYIPLIFYSNWQHWTKEYNYLPTPDKFIEIQQQTYEKLKEKPKEEYFIIRNQNNQLTIILQNQKSYDFLNPYNVFFFGKDIGEKIKPALYWITSVDYINNRTLYCQITCEKDLFWYYYGSFCKSKGQARITTSQLANEHNPHQDGDPKQVKDSIGNCWACDNCFDFCGDLRVKKAKKGVELQGNQVINKDAESPWQPKWGVVYLDPNDMIAGDTTFYLGDSDVKIPDGLVLRTWKGGKPLRELPYMLFLVNKDHADYSDKPPSYHIKEFFNQEYYLPNIYNQQPHLLTHSSAQFYFQKKLLFTANLKHLQVEKRNNCFALIFTIRIRSSISGILYFFESGEIYYKWELKVQGNVSSSKLFRTFVNKLTGAAKGAVAGAVAGGVSGSVVPGVGTAIGAVGGGIAGAVKGLSGGEVKLPPDPRAIMKQFGLGNVKNQDKPENEQQTERLKKSTARAIAKVVEPSIFYSNTVDFNYDFWEFANRSIKNPFEIRFEHSDLLLNQLSNNNNANPLLPFDCRFSQFQQLIKIGKWQGEVDLWFDYGGFWKGICSQGTYFYDNPSQEFKPWRPKFRITHASTFKGISDISTSQGEEEEYEIDHEEKVASGQTGNVGYAHTTFLRTTNPSQLNNLRNVHGSNDDWSEEYGWCWGCFSNSINTHGGNGTRFDCRGTFNPTEDTDIEFFLMKNNQVDRQVASCKAGVEYSVYLLRTGTTIDIYFKYKDIGVRYKEEKNEYDRETDYTSQEWNEPDIVDDNTQINSLIGETDPEKPEGERPEEEQEQEKPETEKELKEKGGELEKDYEKELEKEKEKETEREKERQLERELEKEKEREREKERELEKEKQREREKQAEKDKKDRESQWDKEKKETERKEREARVREKEQKRREQAQKDKERKEKERKERE